MDFNYFIILIRFPFGQTSDPSDYYIIPITYDLPPHKNIKWKNSNHSISV